MILRGCGLVTDKPPPKKVKRMSESFRSCPDETFVAQSDGFFAGKQGPDDVLNLAEICRRTEALGPGRRYAIWVQGCPFDCSGCLAQPWRALRINRLLPVARLVEDVLGVPGLEGVTLSGGEPMLQAAASLSLIQGLRQQRPKLTLILYTGFTLEELRAQGRPERLQLLDTVDVLIDGRYLQTRNENRGLRGSANQRVHFLTDAYRDLGEDYFSLAARQVELHFQSDNLLMVGIPPMGMDAAIREVLPS